MNSGKLDALISQVSALMHSLFFLMLNGTQVNLYDIFSISLDLLVCIRAKSMYLLPTPTTWVQLLI